MTARTWRRCLAGACLAAVLLVGCSKTNPTKEEAPAATSPTVSAKPNLPKGTSSFSEATLSDVPDQILPDKTITGKSVGKLYTEVARLWDQVPLVAANGNKLAYRAVLETQAGTIEMELLPEIAPNHVRNFVALARAGYYDGLIFERAIAERPADDPRNLVELIEGGCPLGLGTAGTGSIGYWLSPEFSDKVKHEPGSVGACRGENPESAACRFYISLGAAPVLDGERTIFGKVIRGLEVARRIATQPLLNSPEFPDGTRPEKPIVIRKVTIQVKEVENQVVRSDNKD